MTQQLELLALGVFTENLSSISRKYLGTGDPISLNFLRTCLHMYITTLTHTHTLFFFFKEKSLLFLSYKGPTEV